MRERLLRPKSLVIREREILRFAQDDILEIGSSKLTDADGELHETQHWLEIALDCGYLSQEKTGELIENCNEIGRLLGSMMDKAALFCQSSTRSVHETQLEYFVN